MLRKTRMILVTAIATMVVAAGLAVPAQASVSTTSTTSFHVQTGNTFTTGTLTFYNRSVRVLGYTRATAGACRQTVVETRGSSHVLLGVGKTANGCAGTSSWDFPFDFTVQADRPGGAAYVWVCLFGGLPNSTPKELLCRWFWP
ncbi:hypothetical protein [Polymorphospora sp. NPDC050346]|uniref:hypothetical protein n=1 Tax=Polymorphospora sp. NPDC050346 TaxID=3155780 RepID=UPI0033D5D74E